MSHTTSTTTSSSAATAATTAIATATTTSTTAAGNSHARFGRSRAASLLRRLCLPAAAAALCSSLLIAPKAEARSGRYCHIDINGNFACIEGVAGPRHNRSLLYSINGYLYSSRHNCYDYNYSSVSLVSIACWNHHR